MNLQHDFHLTEGFPTLALFYGHFEGDHSFWGHGVGSSLSYALWNV